MRGSVHCPTERPSGNDPSSGLRPPPANACVRGVPQGEKALIPDLPAAEMRGIPPRVPFPDARPIALQSSSRACEAIQSPTTRRLSSWGLTYGRISLARPLDGFVASLLAMTERGHLIHNTHVPGPRPSRRRSARRSLRGGHAVTLKPLKSRPRDQFPHAGARRAPLTPPAPRRRRPRTPRTPATPAGRNRRAP